MSFEQDIKTWVSLDNQIKQHNDKIRILKEERSEISDSINRFIEDKNLQNAVVQISDGKLRFTTTKIPQPLTFKYIEQCLGEIIEDVEQVDKIINYIKCKREIKYNSDIKRTYSN